MSETAPPVRHAPRELWLIAQAFLMTLYNLFGAPEDVARRHTLAVKAHKMLASWLRAGEALLRKLLLIEAAALALPPARPRQVRTRVRKREVRGFDADTPEQWRVSFRALSFERRHVIPGLAERENPKLAGGDAGGPRKGDATRFHSAWPLAERYEALLRAFNDPSAVAKRLARRLRAHPQAAARLLDEPPDYANRVDETEALRAAAQTARARFDTS